MRRTTTRRTFSLEVRRIGVAIAGFSVLALGLGLLVVPVPGTSIVVIPLAFAILSKEFAWARRALVWVRRAVQTAWITARQTFGRRSLVRAPSSARAVA